MSNKDEVIKYEYEEFPATDLSDETLVEQKIEELLPLLRDEFPRMNREEISREVKESLRDNTKFILVRDMQRGEYIGFSRVDVSLEQDNTADIGYMYVEPLYRRQKIGTAITIRAEQLASRLGYRAITGLPTDISRRLLLNNGWEALPENDYGEIKMIKKLTPTITRESEISHGEQE